MQVLKREGQGQQEQEGQEEEHRRERQAAGTEGEQVSAGQGGQQGREDFGSSQPLQPTPARPAITNTAQQLRTRSWRV